jgi:uncharacterized protein YbaA (DUF1428 family)
MSYVDGYVIPIKKMHVAKYKKIATAAGKVWRDHGALDYKECIGEDLFIKGCGSIATMIKAKKDETVIFSYILYKSRKQRDAVNAKVMKDPRIANVDFKTMPFDMKRMTYGGFDVIVDYKKKR